MKLVFAAIALAALSSSPRTAVAQPADKGAAASQDAAAGSAAAAAVCAGCGTVTSIRPTALRGEPQWMSTISGGTPGTSGTGGGGTGIRPFTGHRPGTPLPGQEADAGARQRTIYEVVVLMEDSSTRKLHYEHRPALSVGDRVRVSGGQVYLR